MVWSKNFVSGSEERDSLSFKIKKKQEEEDSSLYGRRSWYGFESLGVSQTFFYLFFFVFAYK